MKISFWGLIGGILGFLPTSYFGWGVLIPDSELPGWLPWASLAVASIYLAAICASVAPTRERWKMLIALAAIAAGPSCVAIAADPVLVLGLLPPLMLLAGAVTSHAALEKRKAE